MNKDITTVTVNKATYELMKKQANLDERSVRVWLQRHISSLFSESKEHEDDDLFN